MNRVETGIGCSSSIRIRGGLEDPHPIKTKLLKLSGLSEKLAHLSFYISLFPALYCLVIPSLYPSVCHPTNYVDSMNIYLNTLSPAIAI